MLPTEINSIPPQPCYPRCSSFIGLLISGFAFTFALSLLWLFFGMESTSSIRRNLVQITSRRPFIAMPILRKKSALVEQLPSNTLTEVLPTLTSTRSPRILCWIMTQPANHLRKAIHVQNTWASRCDRYLFMTTALSVTNSDNKLKNVVVLNNTITNKNDTDEFSTRKYLWGRTKQAFRYCYDHFMSDYDWFMKADDDTYVIVENLRHMVGSYNASEPWYFARMVMSSLSGGAGYVMSREALRQFIDNGLSASHSLATTTTTTLTDQQNEEQYCHRLDDTHADDLQMHRCMKALGLREANATDKAGKGKMWNFPLQPQALRGELFFHYWNSHLDPSPPQLANISRYAVSFHHVIPSAMYTYDYLLYHIDVFGEKLGKEDND